MAKTLLAFGDSNTFGTPPMTIRANPQMQRFATGTRWPTVVAEKTGYDVIEEGLPGRTATTLLDPIMGAHLNGPLGLRIALNSCGPIDQLLIMLGTNDQKAHFGLTAEAITGAMSALITIAKSDEIQTKHSGFDLLLICPPAVRERGVLSTEFFGAEPKSIALRDQFAALSDRWDIDYFDAGTVIETSEIDGVHFNEEAHQTLGNAVAGYLSTTL